MSLGGHRVKAEEQLMLLCAGTAARRDAQRACAQKLMAQVDWPRLTEQLRARRLLSTLGPRILELSVQGDEQFGCALAHALNVGRRQGAFLQMIASRVMGELGDAGIASVPLKGPQLSEALYGDPGRRPSADIDLLVSAGQLHRAVEVVRTMGYGAPVDPVDPRGLPLLHFALSHERGELPPVELHWRVHWYEENFARERLLAAFAESDAGSQPGSFDELVALLLFYARDGFVSLRLATDIGAWWDAFGAGVRADALERSICAYPPLERVLTTAASVAQSVVGLPAERFGLRPATLNRRGRVAVRLANPNPRSSDAQIYADMGLIDGLLTPPGGLRAFVKRQVLPPRASNSETPRNVYRRAGWPLWHGVRVVSRYGLAFARLAAAPKAAQPR